MAAQPTPFADPATHALNQETLAYGRELIVQSRTAQPQGDARPPAWTPFRSHLPEALDYVAPGAPSTCISDGQVVACILDEACGDRTYLDSEIVITQICRNVSGEFGADAWVKGKNEIIAAYETTRDNAASIVVIQTDKFKSPTVLQHQNTRYFVLDHFRVGLLWHEQTDRGGIHHYVRLEKCDLQTKSWWTPQQRDPPARREFLGQHGPLYSEPCSGCSERSPHIYNEGILCLNPRCPQFFRVMNAPFAPNPTQDNLTFSERFLMYRSYVDSAQLPPFPLVSDVFHRLNQLKGSALAHSKMLLHGIVCPRDHSIVPKLFWERWSCSMCPPNVDGNFNGDPQLIDLQAVVPRNFVSYQGHPPLSCKVPEAFYLRKFPKQYTKHHMIDKWVLHDDCQLIVLSPTAEFNKLDQGPNDLFTRILENANNGELLLHRHKELGSAVIDDHFHSNWGAQYGFWGYQDSVPLARGPASVNAAHDLLDGVLRRESGFGDSNAVEVMGFMQDQGVQWHTDGEGELGNAQAMILLGGDALFKIRLQKDYHNNEGAFDPDGEVVRGAKNWEKVLNIKTMAAIGHYPDDTDIFDYSYGPAREKQPEMRIPLIHGSIVILQGRTFHKYYENCLETRGGPLSFAIIAREIVEEEHSALLMGKYSSNSERPNGPLFSGPDLEDPGDVDVTPPRPPIPIVVNHVRPRPATSGTRRGRIFPVPAQFPAQGSRGSSPAPSQTGSAVSDTSTFQERKDRLLHLKKTTNLNYEEIRQQEGWTDWNVNAMGSAYARERDRRVKEGTYSPPQPGGGGVGNSTRARRTPRPATTATNARGAWSKEELDELWELRNRNPPVPFSQIEEMKDGARTAKAYREQMGVEKKRRAGMAVTGVSSGAERPTTQQRRATLSRTRERAVTRGEMPRAEDAIRDAVGPAVPDVPPLPNQQWPGLGDRWEAEDEDDGKDEEDEDVTGAPGPSTRG